MGCEGSRVTAEERAAMQHNLGLDHIPHVHLHPHHGHHHLEGFKPNELAHAGHSSNHLVVGHSPHQSDKGGHGSDQHTSSHKVPDIVKKHDEKSHKHNSHDDVRESLVAHHKHGHRDHHNDHHDSYKHTHGIHSNTGDH